MNRICVKLGAWSASLGAALLVLGVAAHLAGARINSSHSIPRGLYWTSSAPVAPGRYVMFCPPQLGVFEEARRRGYIGTGFCPGGYGYMMKKVLGTGNDAVSVAPDGVRVNGHDPGQHAAYVGAWIRALQSDPLEIFRAASGAEKIQAYVLGLEQVQTLGQAASPQQAPVAADAAPFIVRERVGGKDLFSQSFATLDEAARCYVGKSQAANRGMEAPDGRELAGVVWGPDGDFECERFASPEVEQAVAAAQEQHWQGFDAAKVEKRAEQEEAARRRQVRPGRCHVQAAPPGAAGPRCR